ncbi:MAG: hypothetical protein ACODAQ_09680 [Phycisphaeraceae bacterium]
MRKRQRSLGCGIACIAAGLGLHVTSAWPCWSQWAPYSVPVGLGTLVVALLAYLYAIAALRLQPEQPQPPQQPRRPLSC